MKHKVKKIIAVLATFVLMVNCAGYGGQVYASNGRIYPGDTVSVVQMKKVSGAGNGYFTCTDAQSFGYCAQNSLAYWNSNEGKSGIAYEWDDPAIRRVLYYAPGGPGYYGPYYGSLGADMDYATFATGKLNGDTNNNTKATAYINFVNGLADPITYGYKAYKIDIPGNYQDVAFLSLVAQYTVTFVDGWGNTLKTEAVYYGGSATPPANPSHSGYNFIGWNGDYTNVTSNRTITANWAQSFYTNSIVHWLWGLKYGEGDNGGGGAKSFAMSTFSQYPGASFVLDEGRATTLPNGIEFGGKVEDVYNSNKYYDAGVTLAQRNSNMLFHYHYSPKDYSIKYNLNGGINHPDNPSSYNVLYGETINNPTKEGSEFEGWNAEIDKGTIRMPDNNLIYNFGDTNNTVLERMNYIIKDEVVTVTARDNDGYGFINAKVDLVAGKTYRFTCDTDGTWTLDGTNAGGNVEAFLVLNGVYSHWYRMESNDFTFTPTVSGTYWLRLDVNKAGETYKFWDISLEELSSNNYEYRSILSELKPGVTYTVKIDSAKLITGTATEFATLIYDFTNQTKLFGESSRYVSKFGDNIEYSLTVPEDANPNHDIQLLIYAGVNGSTSGNAVSYDNLRIGYDLNAPKKTHNNLIYGLDDVDSANSFYANYSVHNGTVTVTANANDGWGFVNVKADLEAGKAYQFSCNTDGNYASGEVEAFLALNAELVTYYRMDSNDFTFTPKVSGTYHLRLDVNKAGETRKFWDISVKESNTYTLSANDDYTYKSLLKGLQPGGTYTVTMDSAKLKSGTAKEFTTFIYDFSDGVAGKYIASSTNFFGNNLSYTLTVPEDVNPTHNLQLLIYAGKWGETNGNTVIYENLQIEEPVGINIGANASFSSVADMYNKLAARITGNITLTAKWSSPKMLRIIYEGAGATSGVSKMELVVEEECVEGYQLRQNDGYTDFAKNGAKFRGWDLQKSVLASDAAFQKFPQTISYETLSGMSKEVDEEGVAIVTFYAAWDYEPEVECKPRYFTLYEAKQGMITQDELLRTVRATDRENEIKSIGIKDFDETQFQSISSDAVIDITCIVEDVAHNVVEESFQVTIVEMTFSTDFKNGVKELKSYSRFISPSYWKNSVLEGGLENTSLWRTELAYQQVLEQAMQNLESEDTPARTQERWVFKKEDVANVKEYIRTNGIGNSKSSDGLQRFISTFAACKKD